jgi:hypothetical protein
VAVFVGINRYRDSSIRELGASERDARDMAEAVRRRGGVQDVFVLVNEQATRKNVEDLLTGTLPGLTGPGDTVLLFWAGHGGRMADWTDTGADRFRAYLVPYDGRLTDEDTIKRTMIPDATLALWLRALDGRKLLVIVETSHGEGMADDLKGGNTTLLAACTRKQFAFERRERDHGVLTHFLLEYLGRSPGLFDPVAAFEYVKQRVPAYVDREFPGSPQTPVLVSPP